MGVVGVAVADGLVEVDVEVVRVEEDGVVLLMHAVSSAACKEIPLTSWRWPGPPLLIRRLCRLCLLLTIRRSLTRMSLMMPL